MKTDLPSYRIAPRRQRPEHLCFTWEESAGRGVREVVHGGWVFGVEDGEHAGNVGEGDEGGDDEAAVCEEGGDYGGEGGGEGEMGEGWWGWGWGEGTHFVCWVGGE